MSDKNASPILIYQMGKVGSKTVEATLKSLGLPNPIYHTHFLSLKQIEGVEQYYADCGQPRRLNHSRKIRDMMDRNQGQRYKVITLVRDWASREVSDLFENMATALPEAVSPGLNLSDSQKSVEQHLKKCFGSFDAETDYAGTWFDKELKDVLNFDIFSQSFDKAKGYQIYTTQRADILCIRLEDLSRVYQEAFSRFLGVFVPQLIHDNEGSDKQSRDLYNQIKAHFRMSGHALDKIYQSPLMTHFYTDDEIARFKSRWLKEESVENQPNKPRRILIVHSEGNISNNPNLSGLVEILCQQGYQVDVASPRRANISQKSPHPNACLLLVDDKQAKVAGHLVLLAGKPLSTAQEITAAVNGIESYDFIFGVDQAIVEASIIAHVKRIPYGLISYEIFFAEEVGTAFKDPEIAACRDIALAVCQDPVRAEQLSRENHIPLEKMVYIPVAGRGCVPRQKNTALHDKLQIGRDKKIAIYCGCIESFCMIEELIQSASTWPQDWVLVIHNRYGLDRKTQEYYQKYLNSQKIYFSTEPVDTPADMHILLNSADIGVAFYKSIPGDKWAGNNIRYIGFASGKISTYMQHGLPVMVNQLGGFSDCIQHYQLGMVNSGSLPICVPNDTDLKLWAGRPEAFFVQYLDLDKTSRPLLEQLSRILHAKQEQSAPQSYRVSAIVSTYNSEVFIRGCLQDLVEQTLYQKGQLQIVVINSGSQQNEEAIVKEFQSHYPHIQYIKTAQRETLYAAWNRGIKAAHGTYITNANTDDRHAPDMLEKLVTTLEKHSDIAAVYSYFYVTETPNQTWLAMTPTKLEKWHPQYSRQKLFKGNFMGPFPMWRKNVHQEYGYFDESLKVAGDYEFFLRVSQTYSFMLIPEPLGLYYYNANSLERTAGTRDAEDAWVKALYQNTTKVIRKPFDPLKDVVFTMTEKVAGQVVTVLGDERQKSAIYSRELIAEQDKKDIAMNSNQPFSLQVEKPNNPRKILLRDSAVPAMSSCSAAESSVLPDESRKIPRVSVLMCVYNCVQYIEQALQSVYQQTWQNFEVVVVDDGCTDGTSELLDRIKDHRTQIHRNPQNLGLIRSLNIGLELCRGEYIARMDGDDISLPHRFARQVDFLDRNPMCIAVGSWINRMDENGKHIVNWEMPCSPKQVCQEMLYGSRIPHAPSMYRKKIVMEAGAYDESYPHAEDYDLWLRLSEIGHLCNIPEVLYQVRMHSESVSKKYKSVQEQSARKARTQALLRRKQNAARNKPSDALAGVTPTLKYSINSVDPNAEAMDLFIRSQKHFNAGDMVSARKLMSQYRHSMNYAGLPAYRLRSELSPSPLLSVIIVTMNRTKDLVELLGNLQNQTLKEHEIIIIDNGGTDINTCKNLADIYIQCPINFNLSEGRNIGAAFAKGKIAVFLDDDANVGSDYLSSILSAFQQCDILGLRGKTIPKTYLQSPRFSVCDLGNRAFPTICNQEGNSAFLLSAWRAVGGQDPLLFGHEGSDLTWRLVQKYRRLDAIIYWPDAVIYHNYGDFTKSRLKKLKYMDTDAYLQYKHNCHIHSIKHQMEKLPVPAGSSLSSGHKDASFAVQAADPLGYTSSADKVALLPNPKVSVIISCLNMAEYLPECLESLRGQTLREWELIIVDDGSTDDTKQILEYYAQTDSRIRVYLNEDNRGPYIRRNFAIGQARAPFISIQDADDIMAPQKLAVLLEEIVQDDFLGIVGSFFGQFLDTFAGPEFCDCRKKCITHEQIMRTFNQTWHITWHGSAIIRKSLFDTVGLYDNQPWGSDTFWLAKAGLYSQLSQKTYFKNLPEILTYKREHNKSQTGTILALDPRGRRKALFEYSAQKLNQIRSRALENRSFDFTGAVRDCNCNDFIPKFGHLFEQWESRPLDAGMIRNMIDRSIDEFVNRLYVGVLLTLNSLCSVSPGIDKSVKGLNLLRGLSCYAYGDDAKAAQYLNQEYADHKTVSAMQFLHNYVLTSNKALTGRQRRSRVDEFLFANPVHPMHKTEIVFRQQDLQNPVVSVIIDCRNEQLDFEFLLNTWHAQTCKTFELVLLTSGNSKENFAQVGRMPVDMTIINSEDWLTGAASKNIAMQCSRAPLIAFASPVAAVCSDAVGNIIEFLKANPVSALRGRIVSSGRMALPEWDLGNQMQYAAVDTDALCAFRREAIENAGHFDEGLLAGETLDISWKLYDNASKYSGPIVYVPQISATANADMLPSGGRIEYLFNRLVRQQMYWRLSMPELLSAFFQFSDSRQPANQKLLNDPDVIRGCLRLFSGCFNAVAREWARRAYEQKPDSLDACFTLAVCEFQAGDQVYAVELFEKILRMPFVRMIEQTVFDAQKRDSYADVAKCYETCCMKLAQYHISKQQIPQARQAIEKLLSNKNISLDSDSQMQMDRLKGLIQEITGSGRVPLERTIQEIASNIKNGYVQSPDVVTII